MADVEEKKSKAKKVDKKVTKNASKKEEKKSLWVRFRIFCHGVKSEFKKVHWTSKNDLVKYSIGASFPCIVEIKYSISTIVFVVFCSLFFYAIDIIFALIQTLFN